MLWLTAMIAQAQQTDRHSYTTIRPFNAAVHSLRKCDVSNGHGGRASSRLHFWLCVCVYECLPHNCARNFVFILQQKSLNTFLVIPCNAAAPCLHFVAATRDWRRQQQLLGVLIALTPLAVVFCWLTMHCNNNNKLLFVVVIFSSIYNNIASSKRFTFRRLFSYTLTFFSTHSLGCQTAFKNYAITVYCYVAPFATRDFENSLTPHALVAAAITAGFDTAFSALLCLRFCFCFGFLLVTLSFLIFIALGPEFA